MNQFCTDNNKYHPASFRDPSGYVFPYEGELYRQINMIYCSHYDHLMKKGLYNHLREKNWIVSHEEVDLPTHTEEAYKIIKPDQIRFISYPYEWSFSQLKDAALRTLDIQILSMGYDMTLKDASAYNIQYENGTPIFIDTLSFEIYKEGSPWDAYRQFCQHFLAPLALMAKKDIRLSQLLKTYIDGVPLDLCSKLLPIRSWMNPRLFIHLHLQARMQRAFSRTDNAEQKKDNRSAKLSKNGLLGILNSLRNTIKNLKWKPAGTEWAQYYQATNYSDSSFDKKSELVTAYLKKVRPKALWDLGANTGHFTRLAEDVRAATVAFDIDPAAVEMNYAILKERGDFFPLPLLLDLTNPTPGIGWNCSERESLIDRGPVDCIMALALIHHLAISNNVPLDRIADFFSELGHYLIIEFVPKSDSQVKRLLHNRKDIFDLYTKQNFEKSFSKYYSILRTDNVTDSKRTLYLMEKHPS